MIDLFLVFAVLALPLVLPVIKGTTWRRFFIAWFLSLVGVVLPLFVFFFSFFLMPHEKIDCPHGWLDCFIGCKVALTPLALLATIALYVLEILRVKNRTDRCIVIGLFLGATIAVICFIYGILSYFHSDDALWLLVPFYVAVWYSWRAVQLMKAAPFGVWNYIYALAVSLPFWLASWWGSWSCYQSLPVSLPPDGCFIVTAASRGHKKFVGPFAATIHRGCPRRANQQLITFWQLEALWHRRSPCSHGCFRRVYNRVGPFIARRVTSPWLADAICAALKPLEWTARLILKSQSLNKK